MALQALIRLLAIAAAVLVASAAGAQDTYSLTGKRADTRGPFVNIPAVGPAPCTEVVKGVGFQTMIPQPMTGLGFPFFTGPAAPGGCAPGGPVVGTRSAAPVVGSTLTVPTGFFDQPVPGASVNKALVPLVTQILQLHTTFGITGPLPTPTEPISPANPSATLAPWRQFMTNAWVDQTGRAGSDFTYCFGGGACAGSLPSGTIPALVKYTSGGNNFGGTMGLVLITGTTNQGALVIKIGSNMTVGFNQLGMLGGVPASVAAGRGYGAYDMDFIGSGPAYLNYTLTTGGFVGMVSTFIGNLIPNMTNTNLGFPWTTGTVVARHTGTNNSAPIGATVSAMGTDTVTSMGARNIQLVAGSITGNNVAGAAGTGNLSVIRLPEPGRTAQVLAAAFALLAVAYWRGRRIR